MAQAGERLTYENYIRNSRRLHMSPAQRAKIFAPYDALEGMFETLHLKERRGTPKVELTDTGEEELDRKFRALRPGDHSKVTYYSVDRSAGEPIGSYTDITGIVARIDSDRRILRIVDTDIPFDSILDISEA